jgi:hypothetical protein
MSSLGDASGDEPFEAGSDGWASGSGASDDGGAGEYDDVEMEDDGGGGASPAAAGGRRPYRLLDAAELAARQAAAVAQTADLLCVAPNEAARVLRRYKWDAAKLQDEWFADAGKVRFVAVLLGMSG